MTTHRQRRRPVAKTAIPDHTMFGGSWDSGHGVVRAADHASEDALVYIGESLGFRVCVGRSSYSGD